MSVAILGMVVDLSNELPLEFFYFLPWLKMFTPIHQNETLSVQNETAAALQIIAVARERGYSIDGLLC